MAISSDNEIYKGNVEKALGSDQGQDICHA